MKRLLTLSLLLSILTPACGAEDSGLECSPSDRDGTYLVETMERSGTCGDVGSFVVQMNNGQETIETGCTIDYERWSDSDCKLERSVTCHMPADSLTSSGIGITEQMDSDGDFFEGTMTITISDYVSGATYCTSTYALSYERQ